MTPHTVISVTVAALLLSGCGQKSVVKPAPVGDPLTIEISAELTTRLLLGEPSYAEVRESMRVPGRIEVDETRFVRVGSPVTGRITASEDSSAVDHQAADRCQSRFHPA